MTEEAKPTKQQVETEEKRKSFVESLHEQHHIPHDVRPSNANREPEILAEEQKRDAWLAAHPDKSRRDYLQARDAGALDAVEPAAEQKTA